MQQQQQQQPKKKFGFLAKNVLQLTKQDLRDALRVDSDGLVVLGTTQDLNDSKKALDIQNARGMAFYDRMDFVEDVFVDHETGHRVPGDTRILLIHVHEESDGKYILMIPVRREAYEAEKLKSVAGELMQFAKKNMQHTTVRGGQVVGVGNMMMMMQAAFGHVSSRINSFN